MTSRTDQGDPQKMNRLEWGVIISIIVSSSSLVFSAGVIWTTVQVHDRDIAALKTQASASTDRLARIETKIDIVLITKDRK